MTCVNSYYVYITWLSQRLTDWASLAAVLFYVLYKPSSQPPQYVPPSSKSNRPPFICGLAEAEFAAAFVAAVVDADPGEFGAIAAKFVTKIEQNYHLNFL